MAVVRGDRLPPVEPALAERLHWLGALRVYLGTVVAGNFVWEITQLPLYTIWQTGTFREQAFAVLHCTGGDLLIALGAITIALVVAGDRRWPDRRFLPVALVVIPVGVGYTVFSEWLNIVVRQSWAYSELMPVVTIFGFGVGVSPILQWIVIPSAALWAVTSLGIGRRPGDG